MQAKTRRSGPVEVKRFHGFAHILAQFFPGVGLSDDAFAQRLGNKAAVKKKSQPLFAEATSSGNIRGGKRLPEGFMFKQEAMN